MGQKLLDPSIDIGNIEYPIDINAAVGVDPELNFYGNYVPLLKFGDTTITWVKIVDFRLSVRLYQLPTVHITVDDSDFIIREYLKNDIQIGVIRSGYKDYALKFNTLFKSISSIINDGEIILSGIIYNEKMFDFYPQSSYKNKSISEILKELCESVGQGLFIYDNDDLSRKYEHLIQSNMNYIEYVMYLLNNYTTNLWTFDANYFLHVGDFDSMLNDELSTYSLSPTSGIPLEAPMKMEFHRNLLGGFDPNNEQSNNKLPVTNYTVNSSYSDEFIHLKRFYQFFDDKNEMDLEQNEFGIGNESSNTFSGFINIRRPFQRAIKAKLISRQVISVHIDYVLPELNPFDLINLEFYRYPRAGAESDPELGDLDIEHSGDKVVIGYDITYTKRDSSNVDENGFTGMTIFCI